MKTQIRPKWFVINIGSVKDIGDITKFEFKIPDFAKRMVGVFLSTNNTQVFTTDFLVKTEVELCLNINNGGQNIMKKPFSLARMLNNKNFKPLRLCMLNEPLIAGQNISGYLKCIEVTDPEVIGNQTIPVKLYLKYLTE